VNILIALKSIDEQPEFLPMGRVFKLLGFLGALWVKEGQSVFDAFDESNPDIFLCEDSLLADNQRQLGNGPIAKCIQERPNLITIIKTQTMNIDALGVLKTIKPNLIYSHDTESTIKKIYSLYLSDKLDVVSIPNGANVFDFLENTIDETLKCDLCHVGKVIKPYDEYINKIGYPVGRTNLKVFRADSVPLIQNLGNLTQTREGDLYKSSKISPVFCNEQDPVPEKLFNIISSGGTACCSKNVSVTELFGEDVPQFDSYDSFKRAIKNPIENKDLRKKVLNENTCFHMASRMLSLVGMKDVSEKCMKIYESEYHGDI